MHVNRDKTQLELSVLVDTPIHRYPIRHNNRLNQTKRRLKREVCRLLFSPHSFLSVCFVLISHSSPSLSLCNEIDVDPNSVVDVPPLLWIPLARFDYDLQRGQRIKLTQPFLFPLELDLAPYIVGGCASDASRALEQYLSDNPSEPTTDEKLAFLTKRCAASSHRYSLAAVVSFSFSLSSCVCRNFRIEIFPLVGRTGG